MPIEILMPALSPTMTEGTLAKWTVSEGDAVESGDVIAEIETDKATMEVEAVEEGTIGKILVDAGTEGVAVNRVIALLLEEGEDQSALAGAIEKAKSNGGKAPAEKPQEPATAKSQEKAAEKPAPAEDAATPEAAPKQAQKPGERVFASPLARRIAAQEGLALERISGTGPHGRVVKRDVEKALAEGTGKAPAAAPAPEAAPAPAAAAAVSAEGLPEAEAVANSTMRKVIARRLAESKQTVPHFYLTVDIELDNLLKLRKELNGRAQDGAYKLSVNDFVIRASALALMKVPAANAMWTDDAIRMFKQADVSVAVATPSGLITPIIRGANGKGLVQISEEMRDLAARARDGKLAPEEFQGGTFTVSNLGMFGIREFSAIINPPQGCILAVGAGEQRPVVKDGALAVATVMSCTLSVDHRVVDGAVGAEFLAVLKPLLEDPVTMLL